MPKMDKAQANRYAVERTAKAALSVVGALVAYPKMTAMFLPDVAPGKAVEHGEALADALLKSSSVAFVVDLFTDMLDGK